MGNSKETETIQFYENAGKWEIMILIFNLDSDSDIKFFDFQLFPPCFAITLVTSSRFSTDIRVPSGGDEVCTKTKDKENMYDKHHGNVRTGGQWTLFCLLTS